MLRVTKMLLLLVLLGLTGWAWHGRSQGTHNLDWQGQQRSYRLHVPKKLPPPAPLLLVLHGGGSTAAGMERWTRMSQLADEKGFLVAYPQGVGKNWNDGREDVNAQAFRDHIDDVGFLRAVVQDVSQNHPVDPHRVYATGASNGGFMAARLGIEASDLFAAVAPVIASVPKGLKPTHPMPILVIQGTDDPLVPYAGGDVTAFGTRRGRILGCQESIDLWCQANGCPPTGEEESLPDLDPNDGCRVTRHRYGDGRVTLYKVQGGGHAWPGGGQYLPAKAIGRACADFNATPTIWDFLQRFSKSNS